MGKKSGPKAPPPPDPVATANAQGQVNRETAITQANLNRVNQRTPEGTLTYNNIGSWEDGTPKYEQVMEYSPEQRALYESNNRIAQALNGTAEGALGRVNTAMGQGFNFDNMRGLMMPEDISMPNIQSNLPDAGGIQRTFGTGGPLTSNVRPSQFRDSIADAGDVTRSVNGDFNATSRAAADAVYAQLASRLDPQFGQLERDMRDRLINSGISENSEAFRREMDNFARQRTDAYNTAGRESVLTGLAAQNQGFGQSMANAELNNRAQNQVFGQNAAQVDVFNTARNAEFNQGMSNAALNNEAQGQQFNQNMQSAAFGNAAQEQEFTQGVTRTGFNNDAELARSNLAFARAGDRADRNNALRQREIEEATYLRNLPLNDIAALLGTGGGVQAPTFSSVPQTGVANTDLMGAVYNSYNARMQQWQQQQANRSQGLGSIFGLAGSLGAAAISDKRLKHNIKAIGKLANGLTTYVFSYIGSAAREFGVMAQEVLNVVPEAVGATDTGILYVNYRKLGL